MTSKRSYMISAAVLAACVGVALGVLAMLPPQPGVTKANFDRIEIGMTKTDVEKIFGMPCPDVIPRAWWVQVYWADARSGHTAVILFDENCRVVCPCYFYESKSSIITYKGFRRWLLNEPIPAPPWGDGLPDQ